MGIHKTNSPAGQRVPLDEIQDLLLADDRGRWQRLQEREDLSPVLQISARKFPHNEDVAQGLSVIEQPCEKSFSVTKMSDPDRGVNQDHVFSGRSSARNQTQGFFRPSQARKTLGAFQGDQRFKTLSHKRRLLPNPSELGGLPEGPIINVERSPHTYKYA